jgi:hypothetical protein
MGDQEQEQGQEGAQTVETTETRTVETTTETAGHGTEQGKEPGAGEGAELAKVRELVLKANPDVVPDLVRGNSVDELLASVEPARGAYQRIAEQVRGQAASTTVTTEPGATVNAQGETTVVVQPPTVPAGGAGNVIDPASIPPTEKIRRGLAADRG